MLFLTSAEINRGELTVMVTEIAGRPIAASRPARKGFFERNKTLTSAIVSIVIAAIGFGSALTVSYIQQEREADREQIAAATDLDTSAILLNEYVRDSMLNRAWVGELLQKDAVQFRRDMPDYTPTFDP